MFNIMLNMKKTVTAREFLHKFTNVHEGLAPGESVTVTRRGKPIGQFTKPASPAIKMPNFLEEARKDGFGPKVGNRLLKRLLADESVC
jgi:hypothetical protein